MRSVRAWPRPGIWEDRRAILGLWVGSALGLSGTLAVASAPATLPKTSSLPASLEQALKANGLSGSDLELELTESALMKNPDLTIVCSGELLDCDESDLHNNEPSQESQGETLTDKEDCLPY